MNQFSFPMQTILLFCLTSCLLFLQPKEGKAQYKRQFPVVDVTTNVVGWTEKTGSVATQVSPLQWLGLRAGVSYSPQQDQNDFFLSQSKSLEFLGEARLFPFGAPRRALKKDTRPAFWRKPKMGCSGKGCLVNGLQSSLKKTLAGLFVAPGYSFQRRQEEFIPQGNQPSQLPVEGFQNRSINQGPILTAGYQLRLRNFTLSAGYGFKASKAKSAGTGTVPAPALISTRAVQPGFQKKFDFQPRLYMEVGINF